MNENVLVSETARRSGSWLHYYANPGRFLRLAKPALPWLAAFSIAVTAIGVIWGYAFAPADWEQGNAARIMYVHVPAAWVAMAGYAALAVCSFFSIIWRHPLADLAAEEIGPVALGVLAPLAALSRDLAQSDRYLGGPQAGNLHRVQQRLDVGSHGGASWRRATAVTASSTL